jgi:threonine synthase
MRMFDYAWTGGDLPTFVTHLECSLTGEHYPADQLHGLSHVGRPLLVRYDLDGIRAALPREALAARPQTLWRYRELLPVRRPENVVALGEIITPLVALPRIAGRLAHGGEILVKDEGRLPTGSFKARGLALAVSMAKELGVTSMAMPTNGNAGAAMAAYCARAGIKATVFCPDDTPAVNVREIAMQGAEVFLVDGLIDDCGRIVAEGEREAGWFNCSTLREPYRIEGKKTMGLELAEQFGWEVPDVIFYPTGGGTGIIGMWKAFAELETLGWIGARRPRMVVVQAAGCAPIVNAWEAGVEHAARWQDAHTFAAGIRVPQAVGDFLILRAVRESGGFAIAIDDDAIAAAWREVAAEEGLLLCPEGAATYAAYKQAVADGRVRPGERAVLFNCATGLKYPMPEAGTHLKLGEPIDWRHVAGRGAPSQQGRERAAEILLHMIGHGDRRFVEPGWAGQPGGRQQIEAISVRPGEGLASRAIEFRAFAPNGRATSWVSDGKYAGTRDQELPLTGFAVRPAADWGDLFDVVYEGCFFAGGVVGPRTNGEICTSPVVDDPLEAVRVTIVQRVPVS